MHSVEAMVAIAHRRLRLRRMLVAIENNPQLLEGTDMEIRRPMELAGLRSRLARAKSLETDIAVTGKRFDAVLDAIDELHGAARGHVGQLEGQKAELAKLVDSMIAGDNGAPNDQSGSSGEFSSGQVISSETQS